MNPSVPIFWDLLAHGGRKLRTDTHTNTHTRDNYRNPHCACTPRVNYYDDDMLLVLCPLHVAVVVQQRKVKHLLR